MAIEEQTARTVFKGDGSARAFPVTWYLDAEENVIVKMTNVTTAQVKTLKLGTDYTVTPSDDEYPTNGAVINYPKNSVTPALGSDYRLTVIRNVPYTQSFVFPNNTRLLPKNIEGGLDGLELQIQQINDKADNAVSIPAGMDYNNDEFVAELFDKAKSAEQSAINAKASETNAKASATNASQSAQTATTKANEAKESATSASQSAQTATTKAQEAISSATSAKKSETNAKASATNAKTSETNASQSAQTATTKANEASSSATNAKTSETNANSYKEQASLSAQTATTKANEASSSATNANQSATSAKTSEISASQSAQTATTKAQEASSSATNAKSSATSAKESEDKAQEYAERAENASSSVGNPVSNVTVDNNIITVTKGVGGSAYYTVDNVANATKATKAAQDVNGNPIVFHYLSRNQTLKNDMNACTVEGIYRFSGTLSNAWTGTSWGTLLVFNNNYNGGSGTSGTYLVQMALPTDGRIWMRQRVNANAWTGWVALARTSDNVASATKATQDSDGNAINTTYLKRSGGTMTGNYIVAKPWELLFLKNGTEKHDGMAFYVSNSSGNAGIVDYSQSEQRNLLVCSPGGLPHFEKGLTTPTLTRKDKSTKIPNTEWVLNNTLYHTNEIIKNFDTLYEEGIYRFEGVITGGWTSGNTWGTILVFNNKLTTAGGTSGTYISQTAHDANGGIYVRCRNGTQGWSTWQKLVTEEYVKNYAMKKEPTRTVLMDTWKTSGDIELSESWRNFDELMIVSTSDTKRGQALNYIKTRDLSDWISDKESDRYLNIAGGGYTYFIQKTSTDTKLVYFNDATSGIAKVIGIKY